MPWVETETDEEFLEFVRSYSTKNRPKVFELLKKYKDKQIIIFNSREEADRFLENIR